MYTEHLIEGSHTGKNMIILGTVDAFFPRGENVWRGKDLGGEKSSGEKTKRGKVSAGKCLGGEKT